MQPSIEKRKNENEISNLINMFQEKPVKKLSCHARHNKKRKLEKEQNSTLSRDYNISRPIFPLITSDIIFDPNRHWTQHATRGLCTRDKIYYIENEWKSVPLCPLDRISLGGVKICKEISAKDLLVDMLIREARSANNIELSDVPSNFLLLVNKEIIKMGEYDDANSYSDNAKNKRLWVALGRWLGMEEPVIRRDVCRHLRSKWIDLKYAVDFQNNELQDILRTTSYISQKEKACLIISARDNLFSFKKLVKLRHLTVSECVTDVEGRTLVHLALLNNPGAVIQATDAVNYYYFHTLNNPSYRSDEFWKNFIEHFGVYTQNNLLLFTSSNTASSHNTAHQECVNTLLRNLGPLSTSVNEFVRKFYGNLYEKVEKLAWGPFAPRPFGIFPMIAINYNTTSDYYWDEHDEPNSLCCLVALGEFEGGELCFPQLQIVVPLQPGQVVAFSSRLLLHGNFPLTKGIRHSIVYFVHETFFHNL
ncbi:calnexin independence factor cif1 [Gigaspora margarita]|uniref:Calnexin independence factor cif1 n=1 Tax=Gigaspora margarita TaxID=4874 RepID=A0A8H4EQ83_GIGMA|nr:calnexin independence factor cif1 [Gigaspora margarita]